MGTKVRFFSLAAILLLAGIQAGWTSKEKMVKVTVEEPKISTQVFDPVADRSSYPVVHGRPDGISTWYFAPRVSLSLQFLSSRSEPEKVFAVFETVSITTTLDIVNWQPANAIARQLEYVAGRERIARRVYQEFAEKAARQVGAKYIGRRTPRPRRPQFQDELARFAKEATEKAGADISIEIIKIFSAELERVMKAYDTVTENGKNDVPIDQAVNRAFADARK